MELIFVLVVLSASIFMSIAIGASSIASVFGPVASGGSTGIMRSALLAGLAALLGAVFQGKRVTETIGTGLLGESLGILQALIILLIASSLIITSALTDYPMPTAFTVVGAIVGVGLGFSMDVQWDAVNTILIYWLLMPIIGFIMGYILYLLVKRFIPEEGDEGRFRYMILILGLLLAFNAGANTVAKSIGPLMVLDIDMIYLLILGGITMMLGCWILSPRVINAISFDYSNIGPRRSIVTLSTVIILAQVGNMAGVPIAFVQVIITTIIGSGMAAGTGNIARKKVLLTMVGWTSAFFIALALAFFVGRLIGSNPVQLTKF